jgi:hypothetical protein
MGTFIPSIRRSGIQGEYRCRFMTFLGPFACLAVAHYTVSAFSEIVFAHVIVFMRGMALPDLTGLSGLRGDAIELKPGYV